MDTNDLKSQIEDIQARNNRVEADKAWETSWIRRCYISAATYVFALLWLIVIDVDRPGLNAFVPTIGYMLSTISLSSIKRRWMKRKTR